MTPEKFEQNLAQKIQRIQNILGNKAKEYSFNNDRFYNFKKAAQISGQTDIECAWGFALKHLVSVIDIMDGRLSASPRHVTEKFGDLINYLIIIESMFEERTENEKISEPRPRTIRKEKITEGAKT